MLIILAILLALGAWWLWREGRIDACNSGSGEWNYETGTCDPLAR
jgi:hypothetical protein